MARLIDWLYGMVIGAATSIVLAFIVATMEALGVSRTGASNPDLRTMTPAQFSRVFLLGSLFYFTGYTAYHTICETMAGATVGKSILRLRVENGNGELPDLRGAFLRNVVYFIDFMTLGIPLLLDPKNRRLGDKLSGTQVVRTGTSLTQCNGESFIRNPFFAILLGSVVWACSVALWLYAFGR